MVKPLYTVTVQKNRADGELDWYVQGIKSDLRVSGCLEEERLEQKKLFDKVCDRNKVNIIGFEFGEFEVGYWKYRVNWLDEGHAVWTDWIDFSPWNGDRRSAYDCMCTLYNDGLDVSFVKPGIATNNGKSLQESWRNALTDLIRHLAGCTR